VLICLKEECRCTVQPSAIVRHLQRQHHVPIELRKQVEQYIQLFPGSYDYSTVPLPQDGSIPQPIIPVVNGFECIECAFKTQHRGNVRRHGSKEHSKQRAEDKEMYTHVRLQSWFRNGKERYWVVDEPALLIAQPEDHVIVRDVGEDSPEPDDSTDESTNQDEPTEPESASKLTAVNMEQN
jgi:hypothetical protein